MAYQQYRSGSTYYGYDPQKQEGIAFSNPQSFNKYFGSFDANAQAPNFDTSKLMAAPDQMISLAPAVQQAPVNPAPQAQAQPASPQAPAYPSYTPTPYTPPLMFSPYS
jgi:hypothetical protein